MEVEAEALVERLDPLIIDLTFDDLGLTPEEMSNLDEAVLLPAMRQAIDDAIGVDESLREGLPDIPTQLDKVVESVINIVRENNPSIQWPDDLSGEVIYDENGQLVYYDDNGVNTISHSRGVIET